MTENVVKMMVASEVRSQLLTPSVKYTMKDINTFPPVKILPETEKLRILVTGGAGFVGSHLVDRLMMAGHHVIVADNMFTGRQKNIMQWLGHPHFQLVIHDVVEPIMLEVDQIYHLACPASPPHYQVGYVDYDIVEWYDLSLMNSFVISCIMLFHSIIPSRLLRQARKVL